MVMTNANKVTAGPVNLALLVRRQILSEEMAIFLSEAYRSNINIAVIGGNNEGKTTILRALMNEDPNARTVVLGDSNEYSTDYGNMRFVLFDPEASYKGNFNKSFEDVASLRPDRVIFDQSSAKGRYANKGFTLIHERGIHLVAAFQPVDTDLTYWEKDSYPFELEVRIKRQDLPNNTTRFVISSIDQITKTFGQMSHTRIFSRVNGIYIKKQEPTRPLRRKISQGLRYAELNPNSNEEITRFVSNHQRSPVRAVEPEIPQQELDEDSPLTIKEEIQQHIDAITELLKKL